MFMEVPKAVYFKELIFHEEKLSRICLFLREYILLILTADNLFLFFVMLLVFDLMV